MLDSYSVIVPVLNERGGIVRTLQSISDSMVYFDDHYPRSVEIHGEVIVVDEGSTDGTLELVQECSRANPRLRLVRHHHSLGSGAARNTGVRIACGDVLFYCDADDLYFREHIVVGFSLLDTCENAEGVSAEKTRREEENRGSEIDPANRPIAAVRTGVRFGETILPYWRMAVGNSFPLNLCLRRECHEWMEGFPEEAVYKRIGGCEDSAYNRCLETFFRVGEIDRETVEHVRRLGNSFDLQMNRFLHPPGSDFDVPTLESLDLYEIRSRLEEQKIGYLLDKWRVLGAPPLSPELLNWGGVVEQLFLRQRPGEAVQVAEQANRYGQAIAEELMTKIRRPDQWGVTRVVVPGPQQQD